MQPLDQLIEAVKSGKNILLTGGAGVGKSYNLRHFLEWADDEGYQVARTAMTGMASLQFDFGKTLHRCFGVGFTNDPKEVHKVVNSYHFRTEKRFELEIIDIFIIDEVSMLRADLIELLDRILKHVMNNDEPFGGKQVIFSGDFMQLPPIVKPEERSRFKERGFWCFQSEIWKKLKLEIIYLTEIKRQDDPKFAMALNMIRAGAVNEAVDEYFRNTSENTFPKGVTPVKLMSTNNEVRRINELFLNKIEGKKETYVAKVEGLNEKLKSKLVRDCPAEEKLELKIGAQVMVLVNAKNYSYVNGSMGEYLGTEEVEVLIGNDFIKTKVCIVRLFKNDEIAQIPIHVWKIEEKDDAGNVKVLASFKQLPIKLGWAITIHKSQGMTIDYLEVDLMSCFAEGMAYVALSRARNYEGLRIINWRPGVVNCNKDAFNFYMNLKNNGVI